jgi:predicted AAA+ superfamily ATPase
MLSWRNSQNLSLKDRFRLLLGVEHFSQHEQTHVERWRYQMQMQMEREAIASQEKKSRIESSFFHFLHRY